jgi:hypothetical protein
MGKKQGMPSTEKELIRELSKNHEGQEALLRKLRGLQEQEKKGEGRASEALGREEGRGRGGRCASPSAER